MDTSNVKTVFRTYHDENTPYVMINRTMPQNKSLSYEAIGMLTYLLSKPDDWKVMIVDLQRVGIAGRDKVYRILNELIEARYMTRVQIRDDYQVIQEVVYTAYESPLPEKAEVAQPPLPENPDTAEPYTENPLLHNKEEYIEEKVLNATNPKRPDSVATIPDWRKRQPAGSEKNPATLLDDKQPVIHTALEKLILTVCNVYSLTESQLDMLDRVVALSQPLGDVEKLPSPNDLYESEPLFRDYAENKAKTMRSNGATPGPIIKQLANYTHIHGWLAYKEAHSKPETLPEFGNVPAKPPVMSGGYVPGAKLLKDIQGVSDAGN